MYVFYCSQYNYKEKIIFQGSSLIFGLSDTSYVTLPLFFSIEYEYH